MKSADEMFRGLGYTYKDETDNFIVYISKKGARITYCKSDSVSRKYSPVGGICWMESGEIKALAKLLEEIEVQRNG